MNTETEEHTLANHKFQLPRLPTEHFKGAAHMTHIKLAAAIDEAFNAGEAISNDSHLSDEGKAAKLDPISEKAWSTLMQSREDLDNEAARLNSEQEALEAVPPVANPVQQGIDAEARAWWRGLSPGDRNKLLQSMADEGETGHATFTKYNQLWQALLRTPIPLPDHEIAFVDDIWRRLRRLDNPVEYSRIQSERNALEWAERSIAHQHGILSRVTGWNIKRVADLAVKAGKEKVAVRLGVQPHELALAKLRNRH